MMVGTGAAALADAIALTRHAAELGFAGALVLPPFYYKGVPDDGLVAYIEAILDATAERPIPLYLYHFPAQSGLPWHVALIRRLLRDLRCPHRRLEGFVRRYGIRARGRRRRAAASKSFPRPRRRCRMPAPGPSRAASRRPPISMPTCARAPFAPATARRSRKPWRSASCSTASRSFPASRRCSRTFMATPQWARVAPPLSAFPAADRAAVAAGYDAVRAKRVA